MITQELIERINTLAKKQKAEGLTPAEKSEQDTLRRQYIDAFKSNLRSQLDCIKIEKEDGENGCSCGCHGGCDHNH